MIFYSQPITYDDTHINKCASILHKKNTVIYFNQESKKKSLLDYLNNMTIKNLYFDSKTLYSNQNIFNNGFNKMKNGKKVFTPDGPSLFRAKSEANKIDFKLLNNYALQDIYILKMNIDIENKENNANSELLNQDVVDNCVYIPIYKTILLEKIEDSVISAYFIGIDLTKNPSDESAFSKIKLSI